ncbi:RNase adapter RapZ [Aliiroseovarius sp. PTFE2010]|uniref:RNase adapter RapZ n=1 Tax=Aliiroseovarius sp. PTFE2010 TaxID=3417190 RepID=UPI003CEB3B05
MPSDASTDTAHPATPALQKVAIVTGPAGAGRSTAINSLEDFGFEVIDNLPLSLMPRLLDGPPHSRPLALGLDTRNRDFSANALIELCDALSRDERIEFELLYIDCDPQTLLRRYSETRRRHPLAPAESPLEGIEREMDLLGPVRNRADVLIDTSELTPHALRAELGAWFAQTPGARLAVSVQSFSYKRGMPRGMDMVFDCRFLRNPYWEATLSKLDGRDDRVAAYVAQDPRFEPFFGKVHDLCAMLIPAYVDEGKSHLTIGLGCTGGQHRSVTMAEKLGKMLAEQEWQVSIRHRELERDKANRPIQTAGK